MRGLFLWVFLPAAIATGQWPQWGGNPGHTGAAPVHGQLPERILAEVEHDPFARQAIAESGGSLLAHYQPALIEGRQVYVAIKGGEYISCSFPGSRTPFPCGPDAWNRQTWGVKMLRWTGGQLDERWTSFSDWKPPRDAGALAGWEPVFHTIVSGRFLYMPAAGGDLIQLRRRTGETLRRFQPFGEETNPNRYVSGPPVADDQGNVYYNVLELNGGDPWGLAGADIEGAWLVRVGRRGEMTRVSYRDLIPDAPSTCRSTFDNSTLPWPPSPSAVPPSVPCLSQRPGLNVAPAIAPDGTIYTVSRAHHPQAARYSYVIALNPDLSRKWAASLRDRLRDGCGVLLPIGQSGGCRAGTPANGVDPATNEAPAGTVSDFSTSSPVVTPDGGVLYGAFTRYNYVRGHLFSFSAQGEFRGAYDFGWDTTPAIWEHDGTYSIVMKENNYPVGSYCGSFQFCPSRGNGPYYITQLDPNMRVEWRYQNTNAENCARLPDGSVSCVPALPGGFEWCINAPAVDAAGRVYANAEDGVLYVIGQGGQEIGRMFLQVALGAAYTPMSLGPDGKIYTQNGGRLFVVGSNEQR